MRPSFKQVEPIEATNCWQAHNSILRKFAWRVKRRKNKKVIKKYNIRTSPWKKVREYLGRARGRASGWSWFPIYMINLVIHLTVFSSLLNKTLCPFLWNLSQKLETHVLSHFSWACMMLHKKKITFLLLIHYISIKLLGLCKSHFSLFYIISGGKRYQVVFIWILFFSLFFKLYFGFHVRWNKIQCEGAEKLWPIMMCTNLVIQIRSSCKYLITASIFLLSPSKLSEPCNIFWYSVGLDIMQLFLTNLT